MFAVDGGGEVFFTALAARKPAWRETGTVPADIDHALDVAEPQVARTKHQGVSAEHELIVEAEERFPGMSSAACRQAGGRFGDTATHARTVSQRLSDRAQARSLAAERAEPPASADLVRRLFEWLRVRIEKLLDRLLPVVRKTPEVLPPVQRTPAVLPPVRTKPRVRTPQPDPILPVVARMKDQYPTESSSTWLQVKQQLSEVHKTPVGQTAQAAAEGLFRHAFTREGFRAPLPPPAAADRIEAIKKSLRECAREERQRLGLNLQSSLTPRRPVRASLQKNRNLGHTHGRGYTPGGR